MERKVSVVCDLDGRKIVVIHDILFRGKRQIDWKDVKKYLKRYVGEFFEIAETHDIIYMGHDLPDEYTGSKYTHALKGGNAKAKANAAQGIPELIEISGNKHFRENNNQKHASNAKNGWYRFDTRFALPVYDEKDKMKGYNIFHASLLIRHDKNGKKYLYDVLNIKKETSNPLQQ